MILSKDWSLDPNHKDSKKLNEILTSHVRKLQNSLLNAQTKDEKYQVIYAFYRKYYTLTLCKSCTGAGIGRDYRHHSGLQNSE